MSAAYKMAENMQRMAANPGKSIFVSANAGSGKTRVLVERVSRILLTGTNPDKILCLTYTKAAASEMQTRLFRDLGKWSIMCEDDLTNELNRLEDKTGARSRDNLNRARSLFARALETPGGLKVQTIHAFCERLLKRFPLEAGLLPGTDAIDERDVLALHQQVWSEIETSAVGKPDSKIAGHIALLASQKGDAAMDGLYSWAMYNAYDVDKWQAAGGPGELAELLGVSANATPETIIKDFWKTADLASIKSAVFEMLASKSIKNNKHGQIVLDALALLPPPLAGEVPRRGDGGNSLTLTQGERFPPTLRHEAPTSPVKNGGRKDTNTPLNAFDTYTKAFFKKAGEGDFFKTFVFGKDCPLAMNVIALEAQRVFKVRDQLRALTVLQLTTAVYDLSVLAVAKYRALKRTRRVMDFDDQIYLARGLLMKAEARQWVGYKLDGGVDHILVDEAQDTSQAQWDIVDALSSEFFQTGAGTKTRTIFAVGDEKQSIYGFQGAQPELFLNKIQDLTKKQPQTPEVKMSMSFRSTRKILALVDQIYYENKGILETFDAKFFPPASDKGQHDAHRNDTGIIEFWPAAPKPQDQEAETPSKPVPVDRLGARSSREKLATEIAVQVKNWLASGEPVFDRKAETTRPMRPADILILVQKRTAFFDAVIRNLKAAGVPVAGADRLQLTSSIAVQDMLSLAKFTLLPSDDLSLAEVLKSPLFGWDDEQLFDIAYGRKASLWAAMPEGADKQTLKHLISLAKRFAPYEFFARTLALAPMTGGPSLLQKIYNRIGLEAADVLDVFLARALAHQRRGAPSLQRFILDLGASESTIKREMDTAQDEVRVMTVHGAKGLEAPVVILPDTTQDVSVSKETFLEAGDGFVLRTASGNAPEALTMLADEAKAKAEREAMRLLYVALTRAESRLLICGFESRGKVEDNSWHKRIEIAMAGMDKTHEIETPFGMGLGFGERAERPKKTAQQMKTQDTKTASLPPWVYDMATPQKPSVQFLSPSKLASPEDAEKLSQPVRSPLSRADEEYRFRRGNLIHKLLEILPQIPPAKRQSSALTYLEQQGLERGAAKALSAEVFAIIDNPDFSHIFGHGSHNGLSMAEVSLAGGAAELPDSVRLSGQIDRLCITDDSVWIVDYKSNRPPPKTATEIAPLYVRQMAAYRALARELYPGKKIYTALLWTDGPHMMVIPDALLDKVKWRDVLPT